MMSSLLEQRLALRNSTTMALRHTGSLHGGGGGVITGAGGVGGAKLNTRGTQRSSASNATSTLGSARMVRRPAQ